MCTYVCYYYIYFLYKNKCNEYLTNILKIPDHNKYISPQIQNEIIFSCVNLVLQKNSEKVNDSESFTQSVGA